jgi:hypothetical protein
VKYDTFLLTCLLNQYILYQHKKEGTPPDQLFLPLISAPPKEEEDAIALMIRQTTVLCKLFLIKQSDIELLEQMRTGYEQCPDCGAIGCFSPHDEYMRDLITIHKGKRKVYEITIYRVFCNSCQKAHALISDILIPYGSYSLRFVLHVLRAYLNRNCTVEDLCGRFGIAISTFYKWKKLFKEHVNLWLSALQRIYQVSISVIDDFENIDRFPSRFFKRYGFSFLQNRKAAHCSRDP